MSDDAFEFTTELTAIESVMAALHPLDGSGRKRVMAYVLSKIDMSAALDIGDQPVRSPKLTGDAPQAFDAGGPVFSSFAELFDAAQPKSTSDKALVAGYWLQVCEGAESFDSQSANKELKHLGQGLANITSAIDGLKSQKPALALQLRKSGKSQQARKTYKITVAGIKAVEGLTRG